MIGVGVIRSLLIILIEYIEVFRILKVNVNKVVLKAKDILVRPYHASIGLCCYHIYIIPLLKTFLCNLFAYLLLHLYLSNY